MARLIKPGGFPITLFTGFFLSFLCAASSCPARQPYRISYSPGAAIHALARDRVKDAYERAGLPVEFVPMPHKRSLHSANEGIVDGEVGRIAGVEKSFPDLRRVNVELINLTGAAYVLEESGVTRYRQELLDTVRVGAILGVQWSLNELDGRPAEMVSDYTKLLGMLAEKRVDMALGSTLSVEAALKEKRIRNTRIRRLKPLVFCQPLYHYVHKKNERLVPLLEKALRELWKEGRWSGSAETGNPAPGSGD